MLECGLGHATQENGQQSSATSMKEIYRTNIVSQIKKEVMVKKKRKSQKSQHFDANTDMSKQESPQEHLKRHKD